MVYAAMAEKRKLVIEDSSDLEDSDWLVINRLKRVYEVDGDDAFFVELAKVLDTDLVRGIRIALALCPNLIEGVKDRLAERGTTLAEYFEEWRKAIREAESPAGDQ